MQVSGSRCLSLLKKAASKFIGEPFPAARQECAHVCEAWPCHNGRQALCQTLNRSQGIAQVSDNPPDCEPEAERARTASG